MGAIQASFEGSEGSEGKYFSCSLERKSGSEGSIEGFGGVGQCGLGCGSVVVVGEGLWLSSGDGLVSDAGG